MELAATVRRFRFRFARVGASFVGGSGLLVLYGWVFDFEALRTPIAGVAAMKADAAACFALCGAVLWALADETASLRRRRAAGTLAALVLAIAYVTVVEQILGLSLGLDKVVVRHTAASIPGSAAMRMAPVTAAGFLLAAMALLLVAAGRAKSWIAGLCAVVALLGSVAAVGYLYGSPSLYSMPGFSSVSAPTAINFVVLAVCIAIIVPGSWILELLLADSAGGVLARRLLPAAIVLPIFFGWLRMLGQRAGYYDTWFGLAIYAVANVVGFVAFALWTAASLHRADLRTRQLVNDLKTSEERLRLIVAHSPGAVALFDNEMRYLMASPRWTSGYGLDDQPLVGRSHYDVFPDLPERWHDIHRRCLAGAVERCEEEAFERSDGSVTWVRWEIRPWRHADDSIGGIIIFSEIVTERRRAEDALKLTKERLNQAQKMEAIGRLAGGVAHDFNNLLTAINGYSELLDGALPSEGPLKIYVREIRRAGERAASLTSQLLTYSRKQVLAPRVLDLNAALESIDAMLRRLIGENIELCRTADADLGQIRADPTQIEQLILNLALNARDAMPQGGRLSIETANVDIDELEAPGNPEVTPGRYVMIAVSDTGCGMDADTQARIFEPFFTTKEVGKGTGLGLSTVHGIVIQSGGHVSVSSDPGKGSSFKVYFPRLDAAPEVAPEPEIPLPARGMETVLVVEDEAMVRGFMVDVLRGHGFEVLSNESPVGALAFAGSYPGTIHLLVSDIVMPDVRGPELARRLALSHPETRTLFVSGYNEEADIHDGELLPGVEFLAKPFTAVALLGRVRAVLDAPRA
ncbi:MAG: ATP-binding protein [Candidatus Binatia bacterium]